MYPLNKLESQLKLLRICDLHLKSSGEILPSGVQLIAEHLNGEFLHDCSSIVLKLEELQLSDCSAVSAVFTLCSIKTPSSVRSSSSSLSFL